MKTTKYINNFLQMKHEHQILGAFLTLLIIPLMLLTVMKLERPLSYRTPSAETGTTGATNETLTSAQLAQAKKIAELYAKLPIVQNTFVIDYEPAKDGFKVYLLGDPTQARTDFSAWKTNTGYSAIEAAKFNLIEFKASNSAPTRLVFFPRVLYTNTTTSITEVIYDQNGGNDIKKVYFGLSTCSNNPGPSANSAFERRFSNFLGLFINPSASSAGIANLNGSSDCSSTVGSSPWSTFTPSATLSKNNQNGNFTLLGITSQRNTYTYKVTWKVKLNASLSVKSLYAYYMALDNSGLWNTGTTTANWPRVETFTLLPKLITSTPSPAATSAITPTLTPTPKPTSAVTPTPSYIDIYPTDDASVKYSYPSTNYGSATTLESDASPAKIIYMKFDLSGLAGKTISKAVLRFTTFDSSTSTQYIKPASANSWSESTITYSNRPSLGSAVTSFTGATAGSAKEVALTTFANNRKGSVVTIGIDQTGTDGLDIYSTEYSTTSSRPRIRVWF